MSIYLQLDVTGRHALSRVTQGWSDEDKQALLDGDEEAREAAIQAALYLTMRDPDEVEPQLVEVHFPTERAKNVPKTESG